MSVLLFSKNAHNFVAKIGNRQYITPHALLHLNGKSFEGTMQVDVANEALEPTAEAKVSDDKMISSVEKMLVKEPVAPTPEPVSENAETEAENRSPTENTTDTTKETARVSAPSDDKDKVADDNDSTEGIFSYGARSRKSIKSHKTSKSHKSMRSQRSTRSQKTTASTKSEKVLQAIGFRNESVRSHTTSMRSKKSKQAANAIHTSISKRKVRNKVSPNESGWKLMGLRTKTPRAKRTGQYAALEKQAPVLNIEVKKEEQVEPMDEIETNNEQQQEEKELSTEETNPKRWNVLRPLRKKLRGDSAKITEPSEETPPVEDTNSVEPKASESDEEKPMFGSNDKNKPESTSRWEPTCANSMNSLRDDFCVFLGFTTVAPTDDLSIVPEEGTVAKDAHEQESSEQDESKTIKEEEDALDEQAYVLEGTMSI